MTVMTELKTTPKGSRAASPERLPEGFTDELLRKMSVKGLNYILKKRPDLTQEQVTILKKRRRTLKNRGYAKRNRDKKSSEEIEAERELEESKKALNKWKLKNLEVQREMEGMKNQVLNIIGRCFELGIPLKITDSDLMKQVNGYKV